EWVDLRCPFCAVVSRETMPTLIDKYVDSEQLRIEFNVVAYFGEQSEDAAVAGQAAAEQDMFMEYMTDRKSTRLNSSHVSISYALPSPPSLHDALPISEWVDLRCPFCAVVSRETMPTLIDKYVDSEQLRIEFNVVAYFGEQSEDAAVAGQAAAEQDMFMEYMTALFEAAAERGHPDTPRDKLIEFAE